MKDSFEFWNMELSIINSWGQSRISRETGSARRGQTEAADYLTRTGNYIFSNERNYNQRRDWIRVYVIEYLHISEIVTIIEVSKVKKFF